MKTFVIQLELHDDVASVRDKIAWGKAPRVLLVWPKSSGLLDRKLDLVILQRYCMAQGAQLGLVTDNPLIIEYSRELSIPVFETIADAQRRPWRRGRRRNYVFRSYVSRIRKILATHESNKSSRLMDNDRRMRYVFFGFALLAVLMLFSVLFLPSAEIVLAISEREQSLTLSVSAGLQYSSVGISGNIPAVEHTTVVEGQEQIPSSGRQAYPSSTAEGEIVFTNLTGQEVIIPEGTVVTTLSEPVVRFQTLDRVSVPAGIGQSVTASVRALLPGSSGNVAAGQIGAVEGEIGLLVMVENLQPTQGGGDDLVAMPSDQDYKKLRERLLSKLEQTAGEEFQKGLPEQQLLPTTLEIAEVLEELRAPPEGQPGDYLSLKMRVKYKVWSVAQKDIEEVARLGLDAAIPENYEPVENTMLVTSVSKPILEGGVVRWDVFAIRRIRGRISRDELRSLLSGTEPGRAVSLLESRVPTERSPQVMLYPAWWPRLPYLPDRIQFKVR